MVCVKSEKQVTPITQAKAIGRAFSWTRRDRPVRRSVESGRVAPAMNPATQATAWRARTRELRPSTPRTRSGLDRREPSGRSESRSRADHGRRDRDGPQQAEGDQDRAEQPGADDGPGILLPAREHGSRPAHAVHEDVLIGVHSWNHRPGSHPALGLRTLRETALAGLNRPTVLSCGRNTTIRQDRPRFAPRAGERLRLSSPSSPVLVLARPGGLHPLGLAALLCEVGRPGGVAEAALLVAARQIEKLVERAGVLVDVPRRVSLLPRAGSERCRAAARPAPRPGPPPTRADSRPVRRAPA